MLAIRSKANGLEIEFTTPLRIGDGTDPADYKVQQWYYAWTEEISSQEKRDLENLKIKSVTLSEDRKKVFLALAGMKKEHVLYVQLQPTFLSENNDQLWSNEAWYTLNEFPDESGQVNPYPYPGQLNVLTSPEKEQGWKNIFNGETLEGWKSSAGWSVENDQIKGYGGSILLTSSLSYDNFELELDWKVETGAEGGILINVPLKDDGENVLLISPRMQLVDDLGNADAKAVRKHKTGANYDISEPFYVISNPANDYNKARVVVDGDHIEYWVNGIKVTDYTIGSDDWKASLAGTIYQNVEGYGATDTGGIALYSKKGSIWFRNIRIKDLQKVI